MMKQFSEYNDIGEQTDCDQKPNKFVPSDYKWTIGLKKFTLNSNLKCSAINTPSEQLHMNW